MNRRPRAAPGGVLPGRGGFACCSGGRRLARIGRARRCRNLHSAGGGVFRGVLCLFLGEVVGFIRFAEPAKNVVFGRRMRDRPGPLPDAERPAARRTTGMMAEGRGPHAVVRAAFRADARDSVGHHSPPPFGRLTVRRVHPAPPLPESGKLPRPAQRYAAGRRDHPSYARFFPRAGEAFAPAGRASGGGTREATPPVGKRDQGMRPSGRAGPSCPSAIRAAPFKSYAAFSAVSIDFIRSERDSTFVLFRSS